MKISQGVFSVPNDQGSLDFRPTRTAYLFTDALVVLAIARLAGRIGIQVRFIGKTARSITCADR